MKPTDEHINRFLKWGAYSFYYPTWDMDVAFRDFQAGKSLKQVYEERGLPWPEPLASSSFFQMD